MANRLLHQTVVITRPVDQAATLKQMIAEAGGNSFLFPLIEISSLNDYAEFDEKISHLDEYDLIIFISSNAVQHAMPRIIRQHGRLPKQLKIATIGPVTAQELAKFNVAHTITPEGRFDSESLLALPEMRNVNQQRIMIIRGVGGRELLANTLQARGAKVAFGECYQRINPQSSTQALENLWQKQQLHAIVVTSSEAMQNLLSLAGDSEWLKSTILCVNHARIAEAPTQLGLNVAIAQAPGDQAMMACLIDKLSS